MFSQSEKFINTEFYIVSSFCSIIFRNNKFNYSYFKIHNNKIIQKNDLTKNLKELNELRKENNLIKYEIDSYEKNLNEEASLLDFFII